MEIWKTIEEFNNYEVSNYGRVRRKECVIVYSNGAVTNYKEKILKQEITRGIYLRVTFSQNNVQKRFQVHRLVAKYFIKNPENKPCVNHIDGNGMNNNVSNLEWCTHSENERHSYNVLGKINHNRKLTESQIKDILQNCFKSNGLKKSNVSLFANKYSVSVNTISNVINRKYYV